MGSKLTQFKQIASIVVSNVPNEDVPVVHVDNNNDQVITYEHHIE
jgi:hypothetical protein